MTASEVRECMDILAPLILRTGDLYVGLYLRLERELAGLEEHQSAHTRIVERARALAAGAR